jgi:hypothetical protein
VKTIIDHPVFGQITFESDTGKVTVQKGNLAERITWVMHHMDEMPYKDYYPDSFLRACELLGVCGGELDVEIRNEGPEGPEIEGMVY